MQFTVVLKFLFLSRCVDVKVVCVKTNEPFIW